MGPYQLRKGDHIEVHWIDPYFKHSPDASIEIDDLPFKDNLGRIIGRVTDARPHDSGDGSLIVEIEITQDVRWNEVEQRVED